MENIIKTSNFLLDEVQLLVENDFEDFALASRNLNPMLTYVKFILTDDKPNGNNMRIPKDEFANLILTGLFMPIKMALGEIAEGHEGAYPIGVITHLREVGDKIRGLAALWNRERPEDVELIRERYAEGKPLDLSWEIGYQDASEDDNGIYALHGCVLRATTLVGLPAYGGRTTITDVEAQKNSEEETVNELEKAQAEIKELEKEVSELKENQMTPEVKKELERLQAFEEEIKKEIEREEKLDEIRAQFEKAGVKRDNKFFADNEDKLLALSEIEGALEFFVAQVALQPDPEDEEEELEDENREDEEDEEELEEETSKKKLPKMTRRQKLDEELTVKEMAEQLREAKKE